MAWQWIINPWMIQYWMVNQWITMINAQNMPNMISNQLTNHQNMVNYQNISTDRIVEMGYCERSSVA
jgi:hypothetical protein